MNRVRRILAPGAVGLLLCLAGSGVTARPAAAASCYGYACHGRDPGAYGCSVTSSVATGGPLMTLWNRYSANCRANWARGQLTSAAISAGYKMYVDIQVQDSQGHFEYMCYPGPESVGALIEDCTNPWHSGYGGSQVVWSDMVDGTNVTLAAIGVYDSNGNQVASAWAKQ